MGRYNFAAQRVHAHATQLLQNKSISSPPPWFSVVGTYPPPERLVRPPIQRPQKPGKKASKLFKPIHINYEEDRLRWEFFNDHPWELARPRVVLEDDGKDLQKWDWSVPLDISLHRPMQGSIDPRGELLEDKWEETMRSQSQRPLNGEAVVQRQAYLMSKDYDEAAAYDQARKELYRLRHFRETELRVAREEALATGAFFGPGPNEIGMMLEDAQFEDWKTWAAGQIEAAKVGDRSFTAADADAADEVGEPSAEAVEVVADALPATKAGQRAQGGVAFHP